MIDKSGNNDHFRTLTAVVRDGGELTPEQRECLAGLLQSVALAVTRAARTNGVWASNDPRTALEYLAGCWAPVERACAGLTATVPSGGGEHAA